MCEEIAHKAQTSMLVRRTSPGTFIVLHTSPVQPTCLIL